MRRTLGGLLALLVLLPALRAGDDNEPAKTNSAAAEQYQALVKVYEQAQEEFNKTYKQAKTANERQKVIRENRSKLDQLAAKFLALAKKAPKDPLAFDALSWVVRLGGPRSKEVGPATERLLREHVTNPKMGSVCQVLANSNSPDAEKLLRAVLEKNPDHDAQGTACYALAARLMRQATTRGQVKASPQSKKMYQEANRLMERVAGDYTDVAWVRTAILSPNTAATPELIKVATEKKSGQDEKGKGYYTLALRLKRDAEQAAQNGKAAEADKLNREVEKTLVQVAKDYAGVEMHGRKLGDIAKAELFEIRHLAVGKEAPDIEGEDIDGKKFKLSEYRGKVVLLDFWGNW